MEWAWLVLMIRHQENRLAEGFRLPRLRFPRSGSVNSAMGSEKDWETDSAPAPALDLGSARAVSGTGITLLQGTPPK